MPKKPSPAAAAGAAAPATPAADAEALADPAMDVDVDVDGATKQPRDDGDTASTRTGGAPNRHDDDDDDDERASLLRRRATGPYPPREPLGSAQANDFDADENHHTMHLKKGVCGGLPPVAIVIIVVELAERYAYYGVSAVLVLYLQQMLLMSTQTINAVMNAFSFAAYTFVLLGGWVADSYLGRAKTVLVFALFYLVGLVVLTVSASPAGFSSFPYNPTWAVAGLGVGLGLICLGTGGIKSTISPLMADQLGPQATTYQIETAFIYFYLAINLGAVFGFIVTPLLQRVGPSPLPPTAAAAAGATATTSGSSGTNAMCPASNATTPWNSGYYVSFASCAVVFIVCVLIYVLGYRHYIDLPPTGSLLSRSFRLMWSASRGRRAKGGGYFQNPPGREHWLWWTEHDPQRQTPIDEALVKELAQTLWALRVFYIFPVYWVIYLTMTAGWVLQATQMGLPGSMTADQMSVAEPVGLVLFIPIFDSWIYPSLRARGWALNPITRITIGFGISAFSMFCSTAVQAAIDAAGTYVVCQGQPTYVPGPNPVNIFWQVPQYVFLAISEIFASVTSLEYAYSKSPPSMKSMVMAVSLFMTAIGAVIQIALSPVVVYGALVWLFLGLGVAMTVSMVIFYCLFWQRDVAEPAWG